ncbi:MAG: TonB-dependent receptor [Ignavibacteria bacterium]|jgi:iron complex outermembrane receptor protein
MKLSKILFLFLLPGFIVINAQNKNLIGYVYNADNEPIEGANVVLLGTEYGAATDGDGRFQITNVKFGKYKLQISFVGFGKLVIENFIFDENYKVQTFVLAQDEIETGEVIVSTSKYEKKLEDVTVSTAIIKPDVIAKKNIVRFDELLRYVPGINANVEQISIRGSTGYSKGTGSRVLAAIDGVPIYTGGTGEIIWEMIPLTDIERVEIIKGPASSLYGSAAIGGVINIISKKASSKPLTHFRTFGGAYDDPSFEEWKWSDKLRTFYGVYLTHSNRAGKLGYTVSLNKFDDAGYRESDFMKRHIIYLKLDYEINESQSIALISNYLDMNRGNFLYWKDSRNTLIPSDDSRDQRVESDREFVSLIYDNKFSGKFSAKLKSSFYRSHFDGIAKSVTSATSTLYRNEIIAQYKFSNDFLFIPGFEFSIADIESNLFSNTDYYSLSGFFHSEYKGIKNISVDFGVRYDYIKLDTLLGASAASPKIGLNYKPLDNLILRASLGTGFRAPTPSEVFTAVDINLGVDVVENPDLKHETSISFEAGFNYKPFRNLEFDLALYQNEYTDFIEPTLNENGKIQYLNLPEARIQGVEFLSTYELISNVASLSFGYNYLWAIDLEKDEFMKYRPRHTIKVNTELNLYPFEIRADVRYSSKVEEIDDLITSPPFNIVVDGENRSEILVVDVSLGYNFSFSNIPFKIYLIEKNLTSYNYVEFIGNQMPLRNAALSIEAYF